MRQLQVTVVLQMFFGFEAVLPTQPISSSPKQQLTLHHLRELSNVFTCECSKKYHIFCMFTTKLEIEVHKSCQYILELSAILTYWSMSEQLQDSA